MYKAIVFAGTTEGYEISRFLSENKVSVLACVATEYGSRSLEENEFLSIRAERLDKEQMQELFAAERPELVLDATHPYAAEVTVNIREACENTAVSYVRVLREGGVHKDAVYVENTEAAVDYLKHVSGNVLLTTGSKELSAYTEIPGYQERLFARVLSIQNVIETCRMLGFEGKNLIAMQGPFSKELNAAMLRQYDCRYLVTKDSGKAGGFEEKIQAATECGAIPVIIGRPVQEKGISVKECKRMLPEKFGFQPTPHVVLLGIGMGSQKLLTVQGKNSLDQADLLIGARRMVDSVKRPGQDVFVEYRSQEIRDYIDAHPEYDNIVIVLSGDVGFYSGARRLISAFGNAGIRTELITGISSVTYFCSRLQIPWEDVKLMSIHGRRENLIAAVRTHFRTFTLLGGRDNVASLCEKLEKYGFENVKLYIGERLHYPEERITEGTPAELKEKAFDSLCVAIIENPSYMSGLRSCIPDEEFQRGDAPMTKSEVRSLSVAKLNLNRDSIAWDIGAGTGSVTIEMALAAADGEVYAIEKKPAAAALIEENARRFGTPNVEVHVGTAPEALTDLPAPTHAFIGGSSGNMKEILQLLLAKNPQVRVVINAITLETVAEANSCFKELGFTDVDITQIQAAKAKKVGPYEMMMGQNPVYIFAGTGKGEA